MLSQSEFRHWMADNQLSDGAQQMVEAIRQSEPARLVRSAAGNVSGRYPSTKMGVTIQFESHRLELAGIFEMEHDPMVHEYYDQPNQIKLTYFAPARDDDQSQRAVTVRHTPDFFVIRADCSGWEEWKTEEELVRLRAKMPNRYTRDESGRWRCPPGEEYAAHYGLYYQVRSSADINWNYQRNLLFLEDYLWADNQSVDTQSMESIRRVVKADPGLSLQELLRRADTPADDVYALLALEQIYVDLLAAPLAEPDQVKVFLDKATAQGYARFIASQSVGNHTPHTIELRRGCRLSWDGTPWTVLSEGERKVFLQADDGDIVALEIEQVTALVQRGDIHGFAIAADITPSRSEQMLLTASSADLEEANRRYQIIATAIAGYGDPSGASPRTVRRWIQRYREAERLYDNGFVGLIPSISQRGNKTAKLDEPTRVLMDDFVINKYETLKHQTKFAIYGFVVKACHEQGLEPPSLKTFLKAVKARPQHEQAVKRMGKRGAYPLEPFHYELSMTTPRHGDRPWEIGHIDHTQLDVELISSETGHNLGRPWVTFLVDAYSRRLLAFWLDYHRPSYRSCMMVLRICVERHNRLPQIIVVDGAAEFKSIQFEILLARYKSVKKTRPGAKPRFGSVCERLFGTSNTQFIHNLIGNTQIMRNVRQVTKSVNPKTHAVWTLQELYKAMAEWAYSFYDSQVHPALKQSPRDAFALRSHFTGERPERLIRYDREFLMYTYPSTRKGTAMIQSGQGLKINNIYYWSDVFRAAGVEGSSVEVKYDPFDAGTAFAYVGKQWIECHSEHYQSFRGRSATQIAMATAELRRQHQDHNQTLAIRAAALARFLESVEGQEALLVQQERDRETRPLLSGGADSKTRPVWDGPGQADEVESTPRKPTQPRVVKPVGTHEVF